ncbi:hypothetical protein HPB49_000149 [Dermacentor silvarum]|uniref:Uncharacterized protein n=1 Tax=Dermacentor silvarum TaxID=543639 RepID=A0ACB8D9D9_DERSI|nr:hypothetical protein HPB49_000149 [Dermacentor silvarum]
MQLLVDTGATMSLMAKEDFNKSFDQKYQLMKTSVQLQHFSKRRIEMLPAAVPSGYERLCDGELGLVKDLVHRIKLRQGTVPVTTKLRWLPLALRQPVANELRLLENDDFIKRVSASK